MTKGPPSTEEEWFHAVSKAKEELDLAWAPPSEANLASLRHLTLALDRALFSGFTIFDRARAKHTSPTRSIPLPSLEDLFS